MKTDQQRKDSYAAKNVPATVALKVASRLSGMKTGYSAALNSLVPVEIQVQGILNLDGTIPTIDYFVYYNFARQVWARKWKGILGTALTLQAQGLSSYYQDVGYAAAPLIKIALDCFGLTVT